MDTATTVSNLKRSGYEAYALNEACVVVYVDICHRDVKLVDTIASLRNGLRVHSLADLCRDEANSISTFAFVVHYADADELITRVYTNNNT